MSGDYTREDALADLAAVYAELPSLVCKGRCADTCTVIGASGLERQLLAERGKPLPAPPAGGYRRHLELLVAGGDTPRCPVLGPLNTCTAYDVRPLICRLFGLVGTLREGDPPDRRAAMACDHGCVPDRWLTQEEGFDLLMRVERISACWTAAGAP